MCGAGKDGMERLKARDVHSTVPRRGALLLFPSMKVFSALARRTPPATPSTCRPVLADTDPRHPALLHLDLQLTTRRVLTDFDGLGQSAPRNPYVTVP
jgi:hypothetical protein